MPGRGWVCSEMGIVLGLDHDHERNSKEDWNKRLRDVYESF